MVEWITSKSMDEVTDGKVEVNRGYLRTWPDELAAEPLGPNDVHLYESPGHHEDWLNCLKRAI